MLPPPLELVHHHVSAAQNNNEEGGQVTAHSVSIVAMSGTERLDGNRPEIWFMLTQILDML